MLDQLDFVGTAVTADIQVMSLLSTWTGHLANLSTAASEPLPPPPPPPTGDDHGDTWDTATIVGANSTTAGRIERTNDHDFFRFELLRAGRLWVSTTGSTNPRVILERGIGDGTVFRGINDGSSLITVLEAEAGTWYVAVMTNEIDRVTGAYTLQVEFAARP